jgi:hypothetical protein
MVDPDPFSQFLVSSRVLYQKKEVLSTPFCIFGKQIFKKSSKIPRGDIGGAFGF